MVDDVDSPRRLIVAGRYVLGDVLGTGGMSTVYRAHDEVLGRTVAVKLLGSQTSDPALMRREKTEVALLASLNHHSLVTLYDADVTPWEGEERSFLVMEFVDGPTLDARIRTGPLGPADLTRMLIDLADALHIVHNAGVVHRDIKPGNILLAPSHRPDREFSAKLADFGIASLVDSTRITATGTVVGTAAYLSPEQALGQRVGPATDIYSLGLVLLEAATGRREFPGPLMESLTARMNRDPVIPSSLGYDWKSTLTAMTARDPASRPTAAELLIRAESFSAAGESPATAVLDIIPMPSSADAEPDAATVSTEPLSGRHLSRARTVTVPEVSPWPLRGWRMALAIVALTAVIAGLLLAALAIAGAFRVSDGVPGRTAPSSIESPSSEATPSTSTSSTPVPAPVVVDPASPAATPAAPAATMPTAAPSAVVPPAIAPSPSTAGPGNGKGNGKGKGNGNGNGKGHK